MNILAADAVRQTFEEQSVMGHDFLMGNGIYQVEELPT